MNYLKVLMLLLVLPSTVAAQKHPVFYKTGRPKEITYNNAENLVAEKWKIRFEYKAADLENETQLDELTQHNKAEEAMVARKKGDDWMKTFRDEVNVTYTELEKYKKEVLLQLPGLDYGKELLVHFTKGKCFRKYTAHVFAGIEKDGTNRYYVLERYKIRPGNGSIRHYSSRHYPVNFEYPENGILK